MQQRQPQRHLRLLPAARSPQPVPRRRQAQRPEPVQTGFQLLLPGQALALAPVQVDTRPRAVRAHGHVSLPPLRSSKAAAGTVSPLQPAALRRPAELPPAQADTRPAAVHTAAAAHTEVVRTVAARTEVADIAVVHTAAARMPVQADKAVATAPAARRRHKAVALAHRPVLLVQWVPHAIQPQAAADGYPASKGLAGSPDRQVQQRPEWR